MVRLSFGWLFFAFIADLFSLFLLSDAIGAWWTLGWVLFAMALGVFIIFDAGDTLKTLGGIFATPSQRMEAIKETPWLLIVGLLFFIPGVLSDLIAVVFWLPSLRRRLLNVKYRARQQSPYQSSDDQDRSQAYQQNTTSVVIEGEYIERANDHLPPKH